MTNLFFQKRLKRWKTVPSLGSTSIVTQHIRYHEFLTGCFDQHSEAFPVGVDERYPRTELRNCIEQFCTIRTHELSSQRGPGRRPVSRMTGEAVENFFQIASSFGLGYESILLLLLMLCPMD